MAARTKSTKSAPVKTREAVAEEVSSETTADVAGREIATYLVSGLADARDRIFKLAAFSHGALMTGAKPADVSKAIATHAARLITDDFERSVALSNSVTKGGVAMTGNAVKQYSSAYASILSGGMTPSVATVVVAFRAFTSAGAKGLAEAHSKLLADTKALNEGERDAYYISHAPSVAKSVKDASKEARSENAATASADDKAEVSADAVELDGVAEVIAFIKATVARPWSDDDKALLAAALADAVESLA